MPQQQQQQQQQFRPPQPPQASQQPQQQQQQQPQPQQRQTQGPQQAQPASQKASAAAGAKRGPTSATGPSDAVTGKTDPAAEAGKKAADELLKDLEKLDVTETNPSKAKNEGQRGVPSKPSAPITSPPPGAGNANLPARPQASAPPPRQTPSGNQIPGSGGRQRSVFDRSSGPGSIAEAIKGDYDFESANARFVKEKGASEAGATVQPTPSEEAPSASDGVLDSIPPPSKDSTKSFYDRSTSFFDTISSDAKDRFENKNRVRSPPAGHAGGMTTGFDGAGDGGGATGGARGGRGGGRGGGGRGRGRQARFDEERKNMDTFGEAGNSYHSGGRGGGGGRGRGGGGRGRGGPRGRGRGAAPAAFA